MKWLEMPSGKGSVFSLLGLCNCDFALQWKKKKRSSKAFAAGPTAAGRRPRSYCSLQLYKKTMPDPLLSYAFGVR